MKKLSDRWMFYCGLLAGMNASVEDLKHIQDLIDAEEQGLLLKLPCKVGSKVYEVYRYSIGEKWVKDGCDHLGSLGHYEKIYRWSWREIRFEMRDLRKIGKDIFLTIEEAETKLKELQK